MPRGSYPLFDVGFNTQYQANPDLYSLYGSNIDTQQEGLGSRLFTGISDKLNDPAFLKGAGSVLGGFGALAGAYNGYQQSQIAKDQLDFEKKRVGYNIAAQSKAYNRNLRNTAANEALQFGKGNAYANELYNKQKLSGVL